MRTFHLGAILSLIKVKALAPGGLYEVRQLVEHMAGKPLFWHEFAAASRDCADELRRQFPGLASLPLPLLATHQDYADWLAVQVTRFGAQHEVAQLPSVQSVTVEV